VRLISLIFSLYSPFEKSWASKNEKQLILYKWYIGIVRKSSSKLSCQEQLLDAYMELFAYIWVFKFCTLRFSSVGSLYWTKLRCIVFDVIFLFYT